MASEYFHMRKLLWDELQQFVKPSEVRELRAAIGNQLIDANAELARELAVLVEILSEFQQQNDNIRDALVKRVRVPEPPGRSLLLEKLKLLARDVRSRADRIPIESRKDKELLAYVYSETETAIAPNSCELHFQRCPSTPRIADLVSPRLGDHGVPIRPGTSSARRPVTASSQRPVSRGSTLSASSTATSSTSTVLERPDVHTRLNVEQIDAIRDDLQDALVDERQQLLEDIEFIQSCLEMEQDLIDDDRRNVHAKPPPPSLHDLNDLCRTLERALETQNEIEKVETIFSKTRDAGATRRLTKPLNPVPASSSCTGVLPRPPPRRDTSDNDRDGDDDDEYRLLCRPSLPSLSTCSSSRSLAAGPKILKIRHVIQEVRDEPFLS